MNQGSKFEVIIATIPFENLSNDKSLDYFVDGIYDDFLLDLSRFSSLQIISKESAKQIDGNHRNLDILGADFIIRGKLKSSREYLKFFIQLISGKDESIVWAERFESKLEDLFGFQNDLVQQVVNSIQDQVNRNLLAVSRKKQAQNLQAYDYWLKGYDELKKGTLDSDLKAREFFFKALDKDPYCAKAYTGISLSYFNEWSCQLWDLWDSSMSNALKYARSAVELDPNDSQSLTVMGRIYLYQGDYERAEYYLKKSLKLNPNEANNLAQIAVSFVYLGHPKKALELYLKAIRLNPLKEEEYYSAGMLIYFEMGEFKKSIELGRKCDFDKVWVDLPAMLSGAYYMSGELENMATYWRIYTTNFKERICHGRDTDDKEALDWVIRINPYKKQSRFIPFWEFMNQNTPEYSTIESQTSLRLEAKNIFSKGMGLWEMRFKGKTVYLPDKKGYHDIQALISQPEEKIEAIELMGSALSIERKTLLFDKKAEAEYKQQLIELKREMDEYDEINDYENLNKSREKYEDLLDHLSKMLNHKGQSKKFQDLAEKSRSAVTWRIRSAIKLIKTVHTELGSHLSHSISTGSLCYYSPETSIEWETENQGLTL